MTKPNSKKRKELDEAAAFLQSRGYEGPVPIMTALIIESLSQEKP